MAFHRNLFFSTMMLTIPLLGVPAAVAKEVAPYTVTSLAAVTTTQQGRLARARPASIWAEPTPFPGIVNSAVPYQYSTVLVPFVSNSVQDIYYEITIDDPDAVVFASGYNGAYSPRNPANRYLGDEGSSGNYFPADPRFFQVLVPAGGSLRLVFNSVDLTDKAFAYQVSAFSDTMYDENFLPGVPEPRTWALLITGFGAVGALMRRRGGSAQLA